jgi:ribosomal protein S18 acetylase RimI-like enzyme
LKLHAKTYREGFNNKPWDVYGWNLSAEKAEKELTKLVSVVLKTGGALLSLHYKGIPAAFNIATGAGIFVNRLKEVSKFKRLPNNFNNPHPYFETLSKLLKVDFPEFENIGYLADIAVNSKYRGKGFASALLRTSQEYLRNNGKESVLAWTVNPVVKTMLKDAGFRRIRGLGEHGEGMDFLIRGKIWYPTLDIPIAGAGLTPIQVVAEHYFKKLF